MRCIIIFTILAAALTSTTLADSWKFAAMADSNIIDGDDNIPLGSTADKLGMLVNDLKLQGIDFVIFAGDLAEREDHDSLDDILGRWKSQMQPLYDAGIGVYAIRGNHDFVASERKIENDKYLKYFPLAENATSLDGGHTYAFTHKNAKFIGFDQYINQKASFDDHLYTLHSNQGQMMNPWVVSQINNSTSPLNFAFAHEQLFPSKSHPDCMANDPVSRDALVAALGTHHGAYLCGHDHIYLRGTATDGQGHTVPVLIVGAAGGRIYDYAPSARGSIYSGPDAFSVEEVYDANEPYFGYLLVTVYENNTWTGQYRGFRYDTANANQTIVLKPLDSFVARQENGSQVVS